MMNVKKILGFAAVGALLTIAAPAQHAQAATLINPGVTPTVQSDAAKMTTEVRWHGHRGWHRGWHRGHHRHWRRHWR
jgi:hypothetical protein